jgi:hypothetical protein
MIPKVITGGGKFNQAYSANRQQNYLSASNMRFKVINIKEGEIKRDTWNV